MRSNQDRAEARFKRRLWITAALCVLALVTLIVAAFSPAFHFHKGGGNIMPDLVGMNVNAATDAIKAGEQCMINYVISA